ncbi:restriction endonuclease [Flavobacterium covae]|uniref:HNH endonuclease n=1 Tax=Flavobacterium covae TaxID=2906076 RepID=A0ABW8PHR4_9FLAO|nr:MULTISPECIES: HNH endonuclease [Flavobacterium]OWP81426.1 restriction endonuclease [Flavobacterium covae]POR21684.1 restriction endonuclease [Flavobacterium columnare]
MPKKNLWTREELILAFNLYLKLPFGKMHKHTPEIIELANLLGRTPSSIGMRLGNFASCDPYHLQRGVGGLKGGMNQVKPIWDEFYNNQEELVFLSEQILAQKENTSIESKYQDILSDIKDLKGETILRQVKTRVNQSVFREMVLTNYTSTCAITGITIPQLLLASHIIPWSKNEKERLNPENGICLSPLYDKAFDKGLISINTNYQVIVSKELKKKKDTVFYSNHFAPIENQKIIEPISYLPRKEFLEFHLDTIFQK